MKNSIFALALIGLIATSCGTSGQYASSRFDDAIYSGPANTIVIASATDTRIQDLKERTAQTSTIEFNGKEARVVYMDENNTVNLPVDIDNENTYLLIDGDISYEELLKKFESPDYTINLYIENRWSDWDYFYRPWDWRYNSWRWNRYNRYYGYWGNYPYYARHYWSDPFFYYYGYDNFFYDFSPYYNPWGPYWYSGRYYYPQRYYGHYWNSHPYGYYSGGGYYNGGTINSQRGKVTGKRITDTGRDATPDTRDRGVITSIPRQNTSAARATSGGNEQQRTGPVSNSIHRRSTTTTQSSSYGEGTVQQRERVGTTGSGSTRTNSAVRTGNTGNYRRSTSTGNTSRNSNINTQYSRENSSTGTSRNSSSSYERNNNSGSSSSYTRSSSGTTRSSSVSTSSSSSSRSSSGNSSTSSSRSSSGSGYRR